MDKETYEALKHLVDMSYMHGDCEIDTHKVHDWINEVAKDYEDDETKCICPCGNEHLTTK